MTLGLKVQSFAIGFATIVLVILGEYIAAGAAVVAAYWFVACQLERLLNREITTYARKRGVTW